MASQIVELYNALALTSITVNGVAIRVKRLDETPSKLDTADLPVRVLTPISQFLPQNANSSVWAVGASSVVAQITWNIADIMYWQPVAQNVGIQAVADELVAYMRDYLSMLKTFSPPASGSTMWIANVGLQAGVYEYPILSGRLFYGVVVTLTITEKMA